MNNDRHLWNQHNLKHNLQFSRALTNPSFSGVPLAAATFFSSANNRPSSSTLPSISEHSKAELMAKIRRQLENGTNSDADTAALLQLLDEGWYSRKDTNQHTTSNASSPSIHTAPAPRASSPSQQLLYQKLNFSALQDHHHHHHAESSSETLPRISTTLHTHAPPINARYAESVSALGSPHSYATAASVALPQTPHEIAAMELDDVSQLVEDAAELQQRASIALKYAKARLRENSRSSRFSTFALQFMLCMCLIAGMLLSFVFKVIDRCVSGVVGSSVGQLMYSVLGAVAGAAQGLLGASLY